MYSSIKVELSSSGISLSGEITDDFVVEATKNLAEGQSLEESFLEIILLGAKVKEAIQTTATAQLMQRSVEQVRVELDEIQSNHQGFIADLAAKMLSLDEEDRATSVALMVDETMRDLENRFTNVNSDESVVTFIKTAVESYLQKRESAVTKLLSLTPPDLDDPNSVASPLLTVYNHVNAVLREITDGKAAKTTAKKNTVKGTVFESVVFEIVQEIADSFSDEADDPGKQKKTGFSNNDEGDITVDFNSLGRERGRLVIECKKFGSKKSKPALMSELDKGIANRQADYGILITTDETYSVENKHPFYEDFDSRRAILVLQSEDGDIDPDRIRFAYLIAKARVREIKGHGDQVTFTAIDQKIRAIQTYFSRVASLKGSMTTLFGAYTDANVHIDYLADNINRELKELIIMLETE